MKKLIISSFLSLLMSTTALADETIYHIFADGLACPQCAEAIDKILREIEGVERVDILPARGIVNVRMADGYTLDEKPVSTALADAGVTFGRMEQHAVGAGATMLQPGIEYQENSL